MPLRFGRRKKNEEIPAALLVAVRERWPALAEEDVAETRGDPAAIAALLELRLGYVSSRAQEDVDRFVADLDPSIRGQQ